MHISCLVNWLPNDVSTFPVVTQNQRRLLFREKNDIAYKTRTNMYEQN